MSDIENVDPEQMCFVRVPVKAISVITAALRSAGMESAAHAVEQFTMDYTDPILNIVREDWVEMARLHAAKDGEIEFDSDATISHSDDNGEYVLGWVWVDSAVHEDDEEDESDAEE